MPVGYPPVSELAMGPLSSLPVDRSANTLSAKVLAKPVFPCMPSATVAAMVVATVVKWPVLRGHRWSVVQEEHLVKGMVVL